MNIGQGFDVHRFDESRPLIVGGVTIEGHAGLAGDSDADVLSHAIADAVLGAARLGDLGDHFTGDRDWDAASSLDILRETAALVRAAGFEIASVDSTVITETPKMAPHRDGMVANVAAALGIDAAIVSVKATTTDGLGFTGRGEGMAATAVALLTS